MVRKRDETGQFTSTVTPEAVLDVFTQVRGPAITSRDVADRLECTGEAARQQLAGLEDAGRVASRKSGRTRLWWRPDESGPSSAAQAPRERSEETAGDRVTESEAAAEPAASEQQGVEIPEALEGVDFPQGRDPEACVQAIFGARGYLQGEGPAPAREIVMNVMPDHPLGYDVPDLKPGDRYRGSWWRNIVKPGLEALPGVEKPAGGGEWRIEGQGI